MNLANLGLSGINAAQHRLQTAGHNINNAATDGYNRQSVVVSSAGAQNTGAGWVGRGVQTDSIQRSYNNFLYRQLVNAQSTGASLITYGNEVSQVNNLFGDPTVGVSPALQKFFDGIQAVASAPADPAARQELLGRASSLVGQINDANAFLDAQRSNINTQITTVVSQINSYVERVSDLNQQIIIAKAGSGQPPNDLLDQRDQLMSELSQLAGVKVIEQDGSFNLTIGNGQVLLGGGTVFPLKAVPSANDPSRMAVAYTAPSGTGAGTLIELHDDSLAGGSLGGLLQYRTEALDSIQNELGRLATGLALSVNAAHKKGFDLNGNVGLDFFSLKPPVVLQAEGNRGSAHLSAEFISPPEQAAQQLAGQDYRISYDGAQYAVFSVPNGVQVYQGNGSPVQFEGVQFTVQGTPAVGDSWLLQPTRNAAGDLSLHLDNAAQIAAAKTDAGQSDGDNALSLAKLQTQKVLANGTMGLNEAFSQIVNRVGVLTQHNATAAKAQATLIQQNYAAQQAVSGVNLNEEYVNLDRYQEQFRAASRLIDVSATLFDTLLSLGR